MIKWLNVGQLWKANFKNEGCWVYARVRDEVMEAEHLQEVSFSQWLNWGN